MKTKPLKILLTNDDGINAPGLYALYKEMKQHGQVYVVAPDSEQSAVGHAITLSDPLRVENFYKNDTFFGYAVNGTPADCVKIAFWALDIQPDLLISGINLGSNTGINIIYSGTVSAATEGMFLNIPSFAISLTTFTNPNFDIAARFAGKLSQVILKNGLPRGTLLNVNVPAVDREEEITGVMITRQGNAMYHEEFDKRVDPHHRVYYWLTGQKVKLETEPDVDDRAILNRQISITPVHFDLTDYRFLPELRNWKIDWK
ncbi:MAG: 5'/3'-nucleotidase SurE [candidate division KSB1 bacterium]|nr:5'/3'-nucleotidase SurE [candidate division KSB1 bacterium]MDZ7319361.1 5'/3'-nucleotidase SurE [candidate division KSB1 bacterium]MDZ7340213.1 5'/3'-nucleotidase SurE [candidate division KSB1 bacterium]